MIILHQTRWSQLHITKQHEVTCECWAQIETESGSVLVSRRQLCEKLLHEWNEKVSFARVLQVIWICIAIVRVKSAFCVLLSFVCHQSTRIRHCPRAQSLLL